MSNGKGWIGVDFDGTLAYYEKFTGLTDLGPPIPAMVERVKGWLKDGLEVRIVTARYDPEMPLPDIIGLITALDCWCIDNLGAILKITNAKDMHMLELYDDRAVQVELNTGRIIGHSTRGNT